MSTTTTIPELHTGEVPVQTPQQTTQVRQPRNPLDSALLLSVAWKWPSLSKTVTVDAVDIKGETPNTDKRKVHISKDLFDCPELKRLFNHAGQVDEFLYRRCSPFPLKRAVYLLPKDFFHEVENFLTEHAAERVPMIEAAVNVYDQAVENAKIFLGPLFHASDYPSKEIFRASFEFSWHYLQIGISDALKEIDSQIAAREADKMQSIFEEAGEACEKLLRTAMSDLVSNLVEKLEPSPTDGRKKVIRDTAMVNIHEFLSTFQARNLTGDTQLQDLVDQANQLLNGVSPAQLRDNEGLRATVQAGFTEIKEKLNSLIVVQPIRQIRLSD